MANGTWVRKQPRTGSISGRLRFALLAPRISRSWPESRWSSAAVAASTAMNRVAPSRRARAPQRRRTARGESDRQPRPPRIRIAAGRGRSVGSSSASGKPASRSRHQEASPSSTSPWSQLALPDREVRSSGPAAPAAAAARPAAKAA